MKTLVKEISTDFFYTPERTFLACMIRYEVDTEKLEKYIGLKIDWHSFCKGRAFRKHSLKPTITNGKLYMESFALAYIGIKNNGNFCEKQRKRIVATKAQANMFQSVEKFYDCVIEYLLSKTEKLNVIAQKSLNCSISARKHISDLLMKNKT